MEPKTELGRLPRQFAKGAVPVALFFVFLGLAFVMEPYSMIPAFLAIASVGFLTPARIIWAESRSMAAVAATLAAALLCAGIAVGSWATIPIVWVLLATTAAAQCVLRLRERYEERWSDALLAFAVGIGTFALAALIITSGTTVLGLLSLAVLAALLVFRWRVGPPSRDA